MNLTSVPKHPAPIAAGAGLLGFLLRTLLYRTGFDEKGILSASHPLHLACLVLALATGICLAFWARKPGQSRGNPRLRLLLGLLAGCLLLPQGWALLRQAASPLTLIRSVLALAAALAMAVCAFPGASGFQATSCYGLICIAYGADMLGRYRDWSGNPQLPDYVFHVLAGVALTMTAYQTLALHTGLGKPRLHCFFCLLALFLCLLCLAGPESRGFYLSGALWGAACLITTAPPEPEEIPQEETDVPA